MIQANELRIGNYYMFADCEGIVYRSVKEIKHNQFGLQSDYDGVNFEICKPIILNEEWLLKFGFKESDEGFMKIKTRKKSIYLEINLRDKRTILFSSNHYYNDIYHVKYIHELQNLYFALTQKELKI
jgi:hypothetical protein